MGVELYTLRKRAVMVLTQNGTREIIRFLQCAVEHALSWDSQGLVDAAIKRASRQWGSHGELPKLVVQVGSNGLPRAGAPIFKWSFLKRSYCFDHELPAPFGYLGEREIWGYRFRTVREQSCLDTVETARRIDEGTTKVYKDFWHGELFKSGDEFLRSRGHVRQFEDRNRKSNESGYDAVSPRVSKILGLIRLIREKGHKASPADLHFLGSLREKAVKLGYSC